VYIICVNRAQQTEKPNYKRRDAMTKLSKIEGIGEAYSSKLEEAGITSLENLLKVCCDKKGRKQVAEESGIGEKQILSWVNRADLARIKGISTQYADLLKFTGVDTVPELAQRNPENLQVKMAEINEAKKLVRKVPVTSQVQDWVKQAKELPRVVTH
jgi:predicted flap endonuclease-1-like 5' DNA nuclease